MKKVLLAIVISFILIVLYLIATSIIFVASGQNLAIVPYIDLPLRLPKFVFYYFSPPTAQDYSSDLSQRKLILTLFSFVINVLLYSIPIYLLLTLVEKNRTKKIESTSPPPPPFDFK